MEKLTKGALPRQQSHQKPEMRIDLRLQSHVVSVPSRDVRSKQLDSFLGRPSETSRFPSNRFVAVALLVGSSRAVTVGSDDDFSSRSAGETELLRMEERKDESASRQKSQERREKEQTSCTASMRLSLPASTRHATAIPICCVKLKPGCTSTSSVREVYRT